MAALRRSATATKRQSYASTGTVCWHCILIMTLYTGTVHWQCTLTLYTGTDTVR